MKNFVLTIVISCLAGCLPAQDRFEPRITNIDHMLGDSAVRVEIAAYGERRDIVYINLHSDETTSLESARKLLEKKGGLLIRIDNYKKRNITFNLKKQLNTFDPNRIFSKQGIEATLAHFQKNGKADADAVAEVEKFGNALLALIPDDAFCVVALHNNTEGRLSIQSYMPGSENAIDAQEVFANHQKDPDDFFLTTDSLLFRQLSSAAYNIVLQDNQTVRQDGSLSVYFGGQKRCYVNCETEHGRLESYDDMLSAAIGYIEENKQRINH